MIVLLSTILAVAQPTQSADPKHSELLPLFSPIPWERLDYEFQSFYPLDFELIFMYMERNWVSQLDSLPVVFGPSLPPKEIPPIIEEPVEEELSSCEPVCCDSPLEKVCSTLSLRHIEPGGIGYSHGYTTLEALFFPAYNQCTRWPFVDFRLHYFNNNQWAGNLGFGPRFLTCSNVVYGFNTYFDFRTNKSIFFPQVGLGLERLGHCWDIRINGYFPINRKKIENEINFAYPGGFTYRWTEHREGLMGCDMEIGRNFCWCDCIRLYAGIGPYYYGKFQCNKQIIGGRFRALLDLSSYFSLEGIVTYDTLYKTRVQGGLSINFPLGGCPSQLSQPVLRNEIIPLRKCQEWDFNF